MLEFTKIKKVLVANRGEIACRIIRCCKDNGLAAVSIFSKEDSDALHVMQADESYFLPGVGAAAYIDIDEVVKIAVECKADAVVPGYGFLSENSVFAKALEERGIVFAGPSSESVETFGLKHSARELAVKCGVPVVPGTALIDNLTDATAASAKIGYPIILKSTAGGGGMGLKVVRNEDELVKFLDEVISRGKTLFQNSGVFLEKYIESGRHIEVQIFGNGNGDVVAFGERECSIQRRHQKVIEETPSPFILLPSYSHTELRSKLVECAIKLGASVNYKSAGTVEFLVDDTTGTFYFLEMNTRLQVEHGITELVYNVDLMKLMLLQAEFEARGEIGIPANELKGNDIPHGHAIEVRVYAENPTKNFQPSPGVLHLVEFPETFELGGCKIRIDHWVSTGSKISPYFDPLIAKVMVWGRDRDEATKGMVDLLLHHIKVCGPTINIDYLTEILKTAEFEAGKTLTSYLDSFGYRPNLIEFIKGGSYTSVQDLPGRLTAGHGVPLSGPVDPLSFQIANLIVGNEPTVAGLEISLKGPSIKFHTGAVICLSGGDFKFKVNGKPAPSYSKISVPQGSIVKVGNACGDGARAYLAIKGGLPDVAEYLGSKSCTPTLNLGGHQGRVIMDGDCLSITRNSTIQELSFGEPLPAFCLPTIKDAWELKCISGPHDTFDICDKKKLIEFYNTTYTVNVNSNRGCTTLNGQADIFSRSSGNDGGSHPSNILEYPYPTCGISCVGSSMALFGVDGATLSGFVCISVPIISEWWKNGQAKIGSDIKFKLISYNDALKLNSLRDQYLEDLKKALDGKGLFPKFIDELEEYETDSLFDTLLYHRDSTPELPELNVRQSGESMIVIDFTIDTFTLINNGRQKQLMDNIGSYSFKDKSCIIRTEACSGAMGVIFDPKKISRKELVDTVVELEAAIPPTSELVLKSKLYKLPVCFEHSALDHCLERYMHSQRPYAPYLPSNLDFIMKANNLSTVEEFKACIVGQKQVVTAVSFLCANTLSVNLDPRTRFRTSKYNPPRTFTPKGAIGSGSVSQSIYSIDSPGGYMIWAMALPDLCWNTFGRLQVSQGKPWFFDNFDQFEYYEVSEEQLNTMNNLLLAGKLEIDTQEVEFNFSEYTKFLSEIESELADLSNVKIKLIDKLVEEEEKSRAKWLKELEDAKFSNRKSDAGTFNDPSVSKVKADIAANIFKIPVRPGDKVDGEKVLIILEAMKMEIPIRAIREVDSDDSDNETGVKQKLPPQSSHYQIVDIIVEEGDVVNPGDTLLLFKPI